MSRVESLINTSDLTLQNNEGKKVPLSSLAGKVVGLYFSAMWCAPCRALAPQLAKIYRDLRAAGKAFEIVFVSSDHKQSDFDAFFKNMPWLAVPFAEILPRQAMAERFAVKGLPTLVLLDPRGALITTRGKETVFREIYPFSAQPLSPPGELARILSSVDTPVKPDKTPVEIESLSGKIVALFLAADWSEPCRTYLPRLVSIYNTLIQQEKPFEVVFVSSDRSQESFDAFSAKMPWLSVPWSTTCNKQTQSMFRGEGIPAVILFDEEGSVFSRRGRSLLTDLGVDGYPYRPNMQEEKGKMGKWERDVTRLFEFLDINKDGKVSQEELTTCVTRAGVVPGPEVQGAVKQIIADVGFIPFQLDDWLQYFRDVVVVNEGTWSLAPVQRFFGMALSES